VFQGIDFTDQHLPHTEDVTSRQVWLDQKGQLGLDFPNLPYFIDNDAKITEHLAIHQYIADKWMPELLGRTLEEKAQVDMLSGIIWDLKKTATMGCYTDGNKDKLVMQTLFKIETLANFVQKSKRFLIGQ
jgi:glutathione S-transferase